MIYLFVFAVGLVIGYPYGLWDAGRVWKEQLKKHGVIIRPGPGIVGGGDE